MANIITAKPGESVVLSKTDPDTKETKYITIDVGEIVYNLTYVENYEKVIANATSTTLEHLKTISGVLRKVNTTIYRGLVPNSTMSNCSCDGVMYRNISGTNVKNYIRCNVVDNKSTSGRRGVMVPCDDYENSQLIQEPVVESIDIDVSSDYQSKIITVKVDDIRDFGASNKTEMGDAQIWAVYVANPTEVEFFSTSKIEIAMWNGRVVELEQVSYFGNRYKFKIKNLPNMRITNTLLVFSNTDDVTSFNGKAILVDGFWPSLVKDTLLNLPVQFDSYARKWLSSVLANTQPEDMIRVNDYYHAIIASGVNGVDGLDVEFLINGNSMEPDWYSMELEVKPGDSIMIDTKPLKLLTTGEVQVSVPFFFGKVVPYIYTGHTVELSIGGFKFPITPDTIGYYKKASLIEANVLQEQGTCNLYQDTSGNQVMHVVSHPGMVVTPEYRVCNILDSVSFINRMYTIETTHTDHTNCENHTDVGKERYRIGLSGIQITDQFRNLEGWYSDSVAAESDMTRTYDVSCTTIFPAEDVYTNFGMSLILNGPVDDPNNMYRNRWNFVAKRE